MQRGSATRLIKRFGRHKTDTGSPEVQIAVFTKRINNLARHLKEHPKDFNVKRSFYILIGKRNRMLKYLRRTNFEKYVDVAEKLKIRH
ncbi:MAG: 30S ribosomal protein S15 [candidate division Zixibacteria bacterium 4484_93]|nr:MAG: 30S ribosomal protein S15 [candidate division Zixibacteria bacterium 4484_93]